MPFSDTQQCYESLSAVDLIHFYPLFSPPLKQKYVNTNSVPDCVLVSSDLFFLMSLRLSHAVWSVADPPGHHSADDEQLSEGQQHSAHTG